MRAGRRPRIALGRFGRRAFLQGAGSVILAGPAFLHSQIPREAFEIDFDGEEDLRREAYLSPEQFLERYEPALRARRIRIGCSFAPEEFGARPQRGAPDAHPNALRALRVAIEDLGMTDIRLGLRWNHLAPDGETLTPFYKPYLDYCFSHPRVRRVALDIGPIKTFRWPEIHLPDPVRDRLRQVPGRNAEITPRNEVAQWAFLHAERTVEYLGSEYAGRKPVSISLNEPFHGYGWRYEWTFSEDFLEEVIGIVAGSGYFDDAGYSVNSAQGLDLERIADFFERLIRKEPGMRGRLTSGFDIYPFLPPVVDVPVLREVLANVRRTVRDWDDELAMNLERARHPEYGYHIEVTEAQVEPFEGQQRVGNTLAPYQHVLAQCIDRILDPQQDESVIGMFGVEYQLKRVMSGTATRGNEAILELTREINRLHSD